MINSISDFESVRNTPIERLYAYSKILNEFISLGIQFNLKIESIIN